MCTCSMVATLRNLILDKDAFNSGGPEGQHLAVVPNTRVEKQAVFEFA